MKVRATAASLLVLQVEEPQQPAAPGWPQPGKALLQREAYKERKQKAACGVEESEYIDCAVILSSAAAEVERLWSDADVIMTGLCIIFFLLMFFFLLPAGLC